MKGLVLIAVLLLSFAGCSKKVVKADVVPVQKADVKVTMALSGVPADTQPARQAPETTPVYFALDNATIRPYDISNLIELAAFLKNEPAYQVRVEGYCDERGSEAYNMALGQRRADAVANWLRENGVKNEITTISHGKELSTSCSDEDCWQKDRKSVINAINIK